MTLKDMKVGTRMSLDFGGILLLMITAMTITYWSLNHMARDTETVLQENLRKYQGRNE